MCRLQRLDDLRGDRQRVGHRNRPPGDAIGQRGAFDQLHDERSRAHVPWPRRRAAFEAIDLRDVRVIQRGERPGLAVEAGEPLGIPGHGVGQDLDGHRTAEVRVGGAVHLAHPAGADLLGDLVRTDSRAGSERHAGRDSTVRSQPR